MLRFGCFWVWVNVRSWCFCAFTHGFYAPLFFFFFFFNFTRPQLVESQCHRTDIIHPAQRAHQSSPSSRWNRRAFVSASPVTAAAPHWTRRWELCLTFALAPAKPLRVPRQSQTTLNSIILREKALLGGEKSFLFDNLIVQTNHPVDTGHSSPRGQTKTRPFP